jgi:dTDP-4-amino-4,6-dideoxygalactose transaminase
MTPEPRFPREFPGVNYYGKEEEEAVLRVVRSRSPFRYYGASFLHEAENLENEMKARLGRRHAQAVSSGTNGLTVALSALGVGPGQEVLIPGFLWVATVTAVVRVGAIPVLVEIDDSFNMSPEDLEKKITERSQVVLPVHMCGVPVNMPAILDVTKKHGLRVLEDCAQANGGTLNDKPVGSFGDMALFSFQMNKAITAGEGGMIVTDDEQLWLRANAGHDVGVPWIGEMPDNLHEVHIWGAGSRMSELTAAVMRAQVAKLDGIVQHMRSSKIRIKERLSDLPGLGWRRVDDPAGDNGSFLIAVCESAAKAADFARKLASGGLQACHLPDNGLHIYYNIRSLVEKSSNSPDGFPWTLPANKESQYEYGKGTLPRADALIARGVVMPVHSCLSEEQEADYVKLCRQAWLE